MKSKLLGLVALLVVLCSIGCSPKRVDPPTYYETSPTAAFVAANLHATETGGFVWAVADTHSMEPLIWGGDFVVTKNVPFKSLKVGQPIAYMAQWAPKGPPVCHRIVMQDSYGFLVSGDNVKPDIDENGRNRHSEASYRVTEENYLGLVLSIWTARTKK